MNKKKILALIALSLAGGSIYLLPFIKYVFYDQMMTAMNITNAQMGFGLTMYAIGNVILYIPGGILADRLSAKWCMIFSLIGTTALGILFGATLNYTLSNIIWLLLSVTTVLVFWSALMKAVGLIGNDDEKGKMYGYYYAGNGLVGAIGNAVALWVFSKFTDPVQGMKMAIFILSAMTAIAALAVYLFIDDKNTNQEEKIEEDKFDITKVKDIIKNPLVWMISLVILCAYTLFTTSSFFTPYLTDIVGVPENVSSAIQIVRQNLFLILCAPLGGYIVDKIKSTSRWFTIGFSITAALYLVVILIPTNINLFVIVFVTMAICAFGLMVYGVVFSVVSEAKFPISVVGTVIGIASVIGYLPDFYIHSLFGKILDNFGNQGYRYIFAALLVNCLIGAILGVAINKKIDKNNKNNKIMQKG